MKTILYTFIAIFVFGILRPAFTNSALKQSSILIQASDGKASAQQLEQSAKIIRSRLADFSSEKFEVTVVSGKTQIRISAATIPDLKMVESLFTQKGEMAFYETYDRAGVLELLKGDSTLFSLFESKSNRSSDARLGCTSEAGMTRVNSYLGKYGPVQNCKFVWDQQEKAECCLYALKTKGGKGAVVVGSEIESVKYNQEKSARYNDISIKLKPSAVVLWEEVTKRNINHAIAIILDEKVLAAPVVRSVISGGNCSITGNYTESEVRFIAALGNNGVLPLSLIVVQ